MASIRVVTQLRNTFRNILVLLLSTTAGRKALLSRVASIMRIVGAVYFAVCARLTSPGVDWPDPEKVVLTRSVLHRPGLVEVPAIDALTASSSTQPCLGSQGTRKSIASEIARCRRWRRNGSPRGPARRFHAYRGGGWEGPCARSPEQRLVVVALSRSPSRKS